jgi:hypothetical protein
MVEITEDAGAGGHFHGVVVVGVLPESVFLLVAGLARLASHECGVHSHCPF